MNRPSDDAPAYRPSPRTVPTRHAERGRYDAATVHAILDEALVCHVAFVADGAPVVLPTLHVRVGDRLYLHGSTGARMARLAESGPVPVCATVTCLDALILAASAFAHSVAYRSVVVHGEAGLVRDPSERSQALDALVDHVLPGRAADCRTPSPKELAATAVLAVDLREVSAKVKVPDAYAVDAAVEPGDLALRHWTGLVPLRTVACEPVPSPAAADRPVPSYVTRYRPVANG